MQQLSIYSFIFAFLVSATPPVSPFLRYPRATGLFHPSKYVSASADSTSESCALQQHQLIQTCTDVYDDVIDLFPNPVSIIRKFHIHGWRWHSLSLLRDFTRLEKLALKLSSPTSTIPLSTRHDQITKAIHHVIGFNWIGLYRIEKQVFFPFLREKLLKKQEPLKPLLTIQDGNATLLESHSSRIQNYIDVVLKQMEDSRSRIDTISKELVCICLIIYFVPQFKYPFLTWYR